MSYFKFMACAEPQCLYKGVLYLLPYSMKQNTSFGDESSSVSQGIHCLEIFALLGC